MRHLTPEGLPAATRRCHDCGIASGPCQCTPEFELYEAWLEEQHDLPRPSEDELGWRLGHDDRVEDARLETAQWLDPMEDDE